MGKGGESFTFHEVPVCKVKMQLQVHVQRKAAGSYQSIQTAIAVYSSEGLTVAP